MGLLERIKNVIRSNLSDLLDRAEDPDKMIGLLIEDMEGNLRQARAQIAQMTGEKNHFQRRYVDLREQIGKWEGKARIALKFDNDALAREALAKKLDLEERAERLRRQIVEIQETLDDLRRSADSLKSKIENARQKRQELRLQRRRDDALRAINRSHDSLRRAGMEPGGSAMEAIDDAILRARGDAESAEEVRRALYESRFEAFETNGRVDAALDEMKRRLAREGEPAQPQPSRDETAQDGQSNHDDGEGNAGSGPEGQQP